MNSLSFALKIIKIKKVSLLYNIGHNKCKELLPTKLQFKLKENPTWPRITNVVLHYKAGLLAHLRRMLCVFCDPCVFLTPKGQWQPKWLFALLNRLP
jgi:hypothetical protein